MKRFEENPFVWAVDIPAHENIKYLASLFAVLEWKLGEPIPAKYVERIHEWLKKDYPHTASQAFQDQIRYFEDCSRIIKKFQKLGIISTDDKEYISALSDELNAFIHFIGK